MTETKRDTPTADEALAELLSGNKRFIGNSLTNPRRSPQYRARLKSGQHPFAVILTCSDSRVCPEIIFDQGLGDLFVVRVAGNIVDAVVRESIEYAVAHLKTPVVMVLGHCSCGAITVAAESKTEDTGGSAVMSAVMPALERARGKTGDLVDNAAGINAEMVAAALETSQPVLAPAVESGAVRIVPALYDLDTGSVELLGR